MATETCTECGRAWGVTMQPRDPIRCTSCSRLRPDRPALYWQVRCDRAWSRLRNQWHGTVERADARCSFDDLLEAARCAARPS